MRASFATAFLLVLAGNAWAEWTFVDTNKEVTMYADTATIRRYGNIVKMWVLVDYSAPKLIAERIRSSAMQFDEFDCKEMRTRTLQFTSYKGNFGKGEVVSSGTETPWSFVSPGSLGESSLKVACKKTPPT